MKVDFLGASGNTCVPNHIVQGDIIPGQWNMQRELVLTTVTIRNCIFTKIYIYIYIYIHIYIDIDIIYIDIDR